MKPEDLLRKAADLIEQNGWTQGTYVNANGCLCMMGAFYRVCDGMSDLDLRREARRILEVRTGKRGLGLFGWNDAKGRTVEEVIAMLRGERS